MLSVASWINLAFFSSSFPYPKQFSASSSFTQDTPSHF